MHILGDISGIQDFLFDVREVGGKQAATLRFRSLRLQLISECIARRVLWELDLSEPERLLYCAAGKFAIDATGAALVDARLGVIRASVEQWLMEHTHGRLKFTIIADDTTGTAAERNDAANEKLQRGKLRPWAGATWTDRSLVVPAIFDLDAENSRDAEMSRKVQNATTIELANTAVAGTEMIADVSVRFTPKSPIPPQPGRSSISLDRLVRHTPRHPDHSTIEFADLAKQARGMAMLGVLKADVDSLGVAIRNRLGNSPSFQPLRDFSQKLDRFFGTTLDREMSAPNSRWNSIYTVFAGGDDLLLVGPWDIIIDFAAHVREQFTREFKTDGLTISAGCAIVKPKFPIHLSAQQAEDLLEQAKQGSKDQFAVLGDVWKWTDHARIIDAGKQLADWCDAGDIQHGWLHTLLELTLLRRGASGPRDAQIIPEMASSRLHYHVARNWPKANEPGEKGRARQWIDTILHHFDRYERREDPVTQHLPAILRYAMLQTRGKGDNQ